jgi:hypothetical protein
MMPAEYSDPRPAVEHWQINTVKGKTVLTLQATAGERTYKDNDLVTQEDFYWVHINGRTDKFRGTVQRVAVAWDSFRGKAKQVYHIEVTQHDAIDDGRFKPNSRVKKVKSVPAQVANTMAGNIKTIPVASAAAVLFQPAPEKPAGPGVRKFDFDEE